MPANSSSDKLHNSDQPENRHQNWSELSEKARKCPGIDGLERWMDDSLGKLEEAFSGFATQKSMRHNFGR